MIPRSALYDRLADLLAYPEPDWTDRLDRALEGTVKAHPAAARALASFRDRVRGSSVEEIQELYTRTFDINPVCTLEVGWHVYGEDYARGAFLVGMRQRLRDNNLPESCELPDHLTHVLALLGRLAGEDADELAGHYALPALEKMLAGMDGAEHPYLALVEAVRLVVRSDHDVEAIVPRGPREDPPGSHPSLPVFGTPAAGGGCPVQRTHRRPS